MSHVQSIGSVGLGYGMHPITDTKGMTNDEAAPIIEDYIEDNGGTYVHGTRGFWRDRNGDRSTLKAARRSSATPDTWSVRHHPKADS